MDGRRWFALPIAFLISAAVFDALRDFQPVLQQFAKFVANEITKWAKVVKDAGIKAE